MYTFLPALRWHEVSWVGAWYLLASLICFVIYALDKSAASAGRRRISERTLISCGLFCGWPGALMAQRLLRHKTRKTRFLMMFWLSVCVNLALLLGVLFRAAIFS